MTQWDSKSDELSSQYFMGREGVCSSASNEEDIAETWPWKSHRCFFYLGDQSNGVIYNGFIASDIKIIHGGGLLIMNYNK